MIKLNNKEVLKLKEGKEVIKSAGDAYLHYTLEGNKVFMYQSLSGHDDSEMFELSLEEVTR